MAALGSSAPWYKGYRMYVEIQGTLLWLQCISTPNNFIGLFDHLWVLKSARPRSDNNSHTWHLMLMPMYAAAQTTSFCW